MVKLHFLLCLCLIVHILDAQRDDLSLSQTLQNLLSTQTFSVDSVSYTSNGRLLITLCNNTIAIWTRNADSFYIRYSQNITSQDTLVASEISPNGQLISAAGTKSRTYVWRLDPQSGQYTSTQILRYPDDSDSTRITCLSFSSGSDRLVTGSNDTTINVWVYDSQSGNFNFRQKLNGHSRSLTDVTAKTQHMISAGGQDQTVRVWTLNPQSNTYVSFNPQIISTGSNVLSADLSDDESLMAAGLSNGAFITFTYLSQNNTYTVVQSVLQAQPGGVSQIVIASDSAKIATSGADNTTAFWQIQDNNSFNISRRLTDGASSLDFDRRNQLAIGLVLSPGGLTYIQNIVVNCQGASNSNGTNYNRTDCNCNPGYFWYAGQCRLLNCSLVAYSSNSSGFQNTCNCLSGYSFRNGYCLINCSAVTNSSGATSDGDACLCNPPYVWNGTTCVLSLSSSTTSTSTSITVIQSGGGSTVSSTYNCSLINNSASTGQSTSCVCNTGFYWNTFAGACFRDCSLIPNSTNSPLNPAICQCNTGFSLVNNVCIQDTGSIEILNSETISKIDCSRVSYAKAAAPGNNCVCQNGYIWTGALCARNCSQVRNSTGWTRDGGCTCQSLFRFNGQQCISTVVIDMRNLTTVEGIDCIGKYFATYNPTNPLSCNCAVDFNWNSTSQVCVKNCFRDPRSNGPGLSPYNCSCVLGYIWEAPATNVSGSCVLNSVNCTSMPGSLEYVPNQRRCVCRPGYVWSNFACVNPNGSVNCSAIPGGSVNPQNSSICICSSPYYWSNSSRTCVINCNQVNNSDRVDPTNSSACVCSSGYIWNNTGCIVGVNCSKIAHASGSDSSDSQKCICEKGYYWSSSACMMNCFGIAHTTTYSNGSCGCVNGYTSQISNGSLSCSLNCSTMPYSKGQTEKDGTKCKCNGGYRWDSTVGQCVSKKGSDGVGLGVGLGVGIGVPVALLALTGLLWYLCRPQVGMVPMTVMQTPATPALAVQPVVGNAYTTVTPVARTVISRPTSALVSTIREAPVVKVVSESPARMINPISSLQLNGGGAPYYGGYSGGQSANGNLLGLTSYVQSPPIINHVVEKIPVTTTVMDGISSTTAVPPQYTVTDNLTGALSYLNFPFGADNNL